MKTPLQLNEKSTGVKTRAKSQTCRSTAAAAEVMSRLITLVAKACGTSGICTRAGVAPTKVAKRLLIAL